MMPTRGAWKALQLKPHNDRACGRGKMAQEWDGLSHPAFFLRLQRLLEFELALLSYGHKFLMVVLPVPRCRSVNCPFGIPSRREPADEMANNSVLEGLLG